MRRGATGGSGDVVVARYTRELYWQRLVIAQSRAWFRRAQ